MRIRSLAIIAALSTSGYGQLFSLAAAVTGKPFSDEETITHVQTLADGTHITSPPQITRFWRDSEGRTRTERVITPVLPGSTKDHQFTSTEIADPVAGYRYMFASGEKIVHRSAMRPPAPPPQPRIAAPSSIAPHILPAQVVPAGRITGQAPSASLPRPEEKMEQLGSDNIEGVVATGVRITTVYPVNAMGNDRPITVTREIWTSADLGRPVLIKVTDPRGDQTTKLTNISQSEPDPLLFQPPAGYEIKDQ